MNDGVRQPRKITVVTPAGTLIVRVDIDVPVGELVPELVAAGTPGGAQRAVNGWHLCSVAGDPLLPTATLADIGIVDDTVLELRSADRPAQPFDCGQVVDRPLSARNAAVLPCRLGTTTRVGRALLATVVSRTPRRSAPAIADTSPAPPEVFTLAARRSPGARMREAWARGDYGRRLDERIVAPRLRRCATIAVVSPKGGVGKTFVTALLGSLLAYLRRDRVVAVDANPDFGSLGRRLVPEHPVFIDELLAGPLRDESASVTSLDAQLGRGPNGLMVAPAPTDPSRAKRLDEDAYRSLFEGLTALAGTLVLDCGTGLDAPPARAALICADQLVLVTDAQPDTASLVWEAARWLEDDAPPLVLVVNKVDRSSRLDVGALERTIPFARGLVRVPQDRSGADLLLASRFSWAQAPRGWREPLRELAALLIADWRRLELTP